MKKLMPFISGRRALILTFVALTPLAAGQLYAAPDFSKASGDNARIMLETGTIPAARQLPPQSSRGAEGPIRSDNQRQAGSDPSIRDSNPLTFNGLWETLPGNQVRRPGSY